ncbi:MAG: SMC-Scp complex subunit ScpB [Nitriliruptoraceae bacterium]
MPATGASDPIGADIRRGIEAVLFLADEPVTVRALADACHIDETDARDIVEQLADDYRDADRGIEIRSAAGGWRMYSAPAAREIVERWALEGRTGRLTQAALETLAVIAYKQPISRQTISDIRGVNADTAVRSLVARGLVAETGRDGGPGQAVLYGTTTSFLERLGLSSLDDLPPLTDYLPEAPAPDEPELGALKEIRRRLAAAGGRESTEATGDALDAPEITTRRQDTDRDMEDLTDRLETAARSAMSRLRAVIDTADDHDDEPSEEDDSASRRRETDG